MNSSLRCLLFTSAVFLIGSIGRCDIADPLDLAPPVIGIEYRLCISVDAADHGLTVTGIDANSPVRQMRGSSGRASMEIGDRITRVNDIAVASVPEIHKQLDGSDGRVSLTVVDVQDGTPKTWTVYPFKVTVSANRADVIVPAHKRPILHAILIADTNDPTIGNGARVSMTQIEQQLESRVNKKQLNLTLISGDECKAANIVKKLGLIPSTKRDCIFVYYMGHGAFDPRYAAGDPSGGHFADFKSKDLMRRTIWSYLRAAPAKLRIVVSDACNVKSEADPFKYRLEARSRTRPIKGATGIEWLLLGHQGELDLSAASANQFAWYSNNTGGFFSEEWIKLAGSSGSNWDPFLTSLHTATNTHYKNKRSMILAAPAGINQSTLEKLNSQESMLTTTFVKNLKRDINSPVDPNLTREIADTYVVKVPFIEPPQK
ncbi:MAG: hypothetical protein AAF497_13955 [Planctomycetota bacterium]